MSLSGLAIKRGITFAMIYIFLAVFGLFGLYRLKIDLYPDISFPVIAIITTYTGVAPEDIETLITKPIEEAVASVEKIKHIRSLSKLGASLILAEFDWGIDLDKSEKDIRNNIDLIRGLLPDEADEPLIFQFDPQKMPILFMSVSGPRGPAELRELCRKRIKPALERLEGVASVETAGGLKRQIQVEVDLSKLYAQGLSVDTLISTIRRENLQIPAGKLDEGEMEFSLRTLGEYTSVDQIANTVVGYCNGAPLYVKNVAQVIDGYEEITRIIRNNRKPGILLVVSKNSKANTVQVANRVIAELPNVLRRLPEGVEAGVIFNQADFIKRSINNLSYTAVQAFLLTGLVLLFFLHNLRASWIVALSIPISILVTFVVLDLAGLTLNMMSMAGLALAVGMLVDNSIVVLENIYRHLREGKSRTEGAEKGASQVATAIIASTLTTIAVFFPVLFVPGIAGVLFNDMALTICFSLFCSLLVALTLIPLLSSRWLQSSPPKNMCSKRISESIDKGIDKITHGYSRTLTWCLQNRKKTLIGTFVIFGGSLLLVPKIGFDFFPKMDQNQFEIQIERAPGTSLTSTEMTFRKIEEVVSRIVPELKNQNTDIGVGETFGAFEKGSYSGKIRINLIEKEKRKRSQMEIESALRKELEQIAGITFSIVQRHFLGEEGDLIIHLYGEDLGEARILSEKIKETVKGVTGTVDVQTSLERGRPELQLILDRDRISALGLSTSQVSQAVSTFIKGTRASMFRDRGEEYEILVRLDQKERERADILKELFITTPKGRPIPLSSLVRIQRTIAPTTILRRDQQRVTNISATVQGRSLGGVTREVEERLNRIEMSPDFSYEIGGSAQDMKSSFKWLGLAFCGASMIVYMVMASLFESLRAPFIIFSTIPLGMIGVIYILFLTGTPLSVVAFIGVIMLAGIVVNNSIVLVDYINQLRGKGTSLFEAIIEGGRTRLRPILMTSITTILALIPLSLGLGSGGEAWAPMARSVIGGLITSTLVTLLVIPVIYTFLAPKRVVTNQ